MLLRMPRGFFTQSTTILFASAPDLDDVEELVPDAERIDHSDSENAWMSADESLVVPIQGPARGFLEIDVLDEPWPDTMGDPKEDVDLFGAWGMGFFGPLAFPGNLARACQQAVAFRGAREAAAKHAAFVRLRTTYADGNPDTKVIPDGWDPLAELSQLTELGRRILELPEALAYFDPNGEVILDRAGVAESLEHGKQAGIPPLDLFTHVRLFNLGGSDFALMDTVGMDRFFLPDAEVAVAKAIDPNQAASFLRNVSLHHLKKRGPIPDGHTTDGPGGRYRVHHRKESLGPPPRHVARFAPEFARIPDGFLK
jgi:hypothetical protein